MAITLDELSNDSHRVWDRLRADGPVAWVDVLGGWVTLTRDLAVEVMRDPARFTVDDPRFATAQVVGPSMLSLDGPEHLRHRQPFDHSLRPSHVSNELSPWMRESAARLVDQLRPDSELRTELAGPWAVLVMAHVLGLTEVRVPDMLGWYRAIVAAVDAVALGQSVPEEAQIAMRSLSETVGCPAFVSPNHDLTRAELAANVAVFLFGGIETVEAMISNALWFLGTVEGAAERVRSDESMALRAVDESLRLEPGATRVDRYATTDTTLGGRQITTGDLVMVSLAAAGRDPVFTHPHTFDLGRPDAHRHLAFATGPHSCLGIHLARAEAAIIISEFLATRPGWRLDPNRSSAPHGLVFRKPPALISAPA
jgi:cytochrome P450